MAVVKHYNGYRGWLIVELFAFPVGVAVTAGWVNLAACGCWRPVSDWSDRLGRAVGICWIVTTCLLCCMMLLD